MKPPKELEDFVKMLLSEDDPDEIRQEMGVIGKDLIAEIIQLEYAKDDLQEEISRKLDDYQTSLKREYEPTILDFERRTAEFWEKVYKEIGSNGKGKHTLDRKTGIITRKVSFNDDKPRGLFQ